MPKKSRPLDVATNYLEVVGATSVVLFAYAVWPPLALLALAAVCIAASFLISLGSAKKPGDDQ